jgi:hypothetical protein
MAASKHKSNHTHKGPKIAVSGDKKGNIYIHIGHGNTTKTITSDEYTQKTGKQLPEKLIKIAKKCNKNYTDIEDECVYIFEEAIHEIRTNLINACKIECSDTKCHSKHKHFGKKDNVCAAVKESYYHDSY